MRDTDIVLKADKAEWSVNRDEGRLLDAEYRLKDMHARGEASHVYREGRSRTDLKNATYTTCPSGDNFWNLKASEVSLDHEEAVGEGEDVVITIKDIPVFYTPYISFPLNDERKSGFLVPSVGNSDETGFDVRTPYYWNISPNRDATITPRYMSERGLLLNGEYRYLYESGQGEIDAGFLNSDKLKNDGEDINPHYDEDRKHFSLKHESTFDSPWQTDIDYNYVSDDDYLEDFGSSLSLASTTHLNRDLIVGYHEDYWDFTGRFQGYQTITDATEPYKRLPQLLFQSSLPDQIFGLTYDMRAEYVDFDHDDLVTGQRYDIEPAISLPMQTAATFFTPRLAVKHTRYDLEDNIVGNIDETPTRTLPIASVDTGVFFERELSFADTAYIQTLEPRAFYLYIPDRNQDDIPDFDASLRTFNTSQLFSHNRYSGTDRIGDANQLTLALTTRFINDETGQENFSASLGQIQYFSDRDVTLPGNSRQTRSNSDMIAEVAAKLSSSWSARGQLQWDTYDNISNMSSAQLRYRGENGDLLNISHRYRRDGVFRPEGLEQLDISGRWPVTRQWNIVGRYYRSIREQRVLEGLFGVEYDDCCWAYRLVVRNYINDADDDDRNLAIMLEVELKGLGNFGQKAETILQRSILGYGDDE
jgi:LPS-assembly protein